MLNNKICPNYSGDYYWDSYCKTLDIELKQCIDEGLNIDEFKADFEKAIKMPYSKEQADIADELFEKIINAEIISNALLQKLYIAELKEDLPKNNFSASSSIFSCSI
jgi:hypothetical protein